VWEPDCRAKLCSGQCLDTQGIEFPALRRETLDTFLDVLREVATWRPSAKQLLNENQLPALFEGAWPPHSAGRLLTKLCAAGVGRRWIIGGARARAIRHDAPNGRVLACGPESGRRSGNARETGDAAMALRFSFPRGRAAGRRRAPPGLTLEAVFAGVAKAFKRAAFRSLIRTPATSISTP